MIAPASPHGPHRTNSAFYASTRSDRPSSCRRFAMRKHGAGACAFTASGLPEDMLHMLEELEKLAVELGQALP